MDDPIGATLLRTAILLLFGAKTFPETFTPPAGTPTGETAVFPSMANDAGVCAGVVFKAGVIPKVTTAEGEFPFIQAPAF